MKQEGLKVWGAGRTRLARRTTRPRHTKTQIRTARSKKIRFSLYKFRRRTRTVRTKNRRAKTRRTRTSARRTR